MKVVNCLQIGFVNPTIVEYEGKLLETQRLDMQSLVRRWREEFHLFNASYNFVLTLNRKDFNAIQQRTLASIKSVMELLEEQGVYCICRDDVLK